MLANLEHAFGPDDPPIAPALVRVARDMLASDLDYTAAHRLASQARTNVERALGTDSLQPGRSRACSRSKNTGGGGSRFERTIGRVRTCCSSS